jgi:hypothetical protein
MERFSDLLLRYRARTRLTQLPGIKPASDARPAASRGLTEFA